MNISLSGRHMELTKATKEYTLEKIEKLDRFYDRITEVKAVLTKQNNRFSCEVIIAIPAHTNLVVEKEAENLYTAIDEVINISERKLRQFKNKRRGRKGHLHDVPEELE